MLIYVLILHAQVAAAVALKQALERTGNYEVHPFTRVDAALEYLAEHPQDIALVDFTLPDGGPSIIEQLRTVQPALSILATPRQSDEDTHRLDLRGSLNPPLVARDLIPLIHRTLEGERRTGISQEPSNATQPLPIEPSQPKAQTRQSAQRPPDGLPEFVSLDQVLSARQATSGLASLQDPAPDGSTPDMPMQASAALPPTSQIDFAIHPGEDDFQEDKPRQRAQIDTDELFGDMAGSAFGDAGTTIDDEEDFSEGQAFTPTYQDTPSDSRRPAAPAPASTPSLVFFPDDGDFQGILDSVNPGDNAADDEDDPFSSLIASMRTGGNRPPLSSRTGSLVEFNINPTDATSQMDSLVSEIERVRKTKPLPAMPAPPTMPDASIFDAQDDDGLPQVAFEDATITDMVSAATHANDVEFEHVLATLRGDPVVDDAAFDADAAFESLFPPPPVLPEQAVELLFAELDIQTSASVPHDTPAQRILEQIEEDTPLDSFSISNLIASIESQLPAHRPQVKPLPSWVEENERRKREAGAENTAALPSASVMREPDFLPDEWLTDAPLPTQANTFDFPDTVGAETAERVDEGTVPSAAADLWASSEDASDLTTMASFAERDQIERQPTDMETMWLPGVRDEDETADQPPADDGFWKWAATGETLAADAPTSLPDEAGWEVEAMPSEDGQLPAEGWQGAEDAWPDEGRYADEYESSQPAEPAYLAETLDDPYLIQLSASLMDAALELTADAVLLTRDNEIVAAAGRMVAEEIEDLRSALLDDWDADADEVRLRFLTLTENGQDYCVYGRRTVDGMTLTLVFGGQIPMGSIRKQTNRLLEALRVVPIPSEENSPLALSAGAALVEDGLLAAPMGAVAFGEAVARAPYAYVWSTREGETLSPVLAQAIAAGMRAQLGDYAWEVRDLQMGDEYVYLLADVPGDVSPYEIVRDLKQRSATIARSALRDSAQRRTLLDADSLWSEGYLIVTPGRALDDDEIQQFIEFERM